MRAFFLGVLAIIGLLGTGASNQESPYEPLDIVRPRPPVVLSADERALIADVNAMRTLYGLSPVTADARLAQAALLHAEDMAARRFFGHFTPDGRSLVDRLAAVGYRFEVAAENIALDADEPHANDALLRSPGHRDNILDPRVRRIGVAALGVGIGAALYVEDFAL